MMEIVELLQSDQSVVWMIRVTEILIIFIALFYLLRFIQDTQGGGIIRGFIFAVLGGFIVLFAGGHYLNMSRITYILRLLLPGFALFLIVIFQPEIRRGLVRLGQNPFLQSVFGRVRSGPVEEITRAVEKMSKNRIGALITITGASSLQSYIEGGVRLDAKLSHELITTIFYPGTDLHDGAIIVDEDTIVAAGCLLPLVEDPDAAMDRGTRHRAGVGITVETDAMTIIVSEETGNISIADQGELEMDLSLEELEDRLREIYSDQ